MIGRIVSHFEIIEKIGEGGSGVVWKARDLNLPRFAALKFLSPQLADSEDARRRLRREAQAISILSHPHIETIYEVGESDGQLFLALEYLPGGSLHRKIRDASAAAQRFSLPQLIGCALDVAEGLAHAHRHGIIHRDIKPANILCTEENAVKITDFGLAQGFDSSVSSTVSFAGTIPYMSPEQVRSQVLDHRTDIYSLGAMLFEMVTSQPPFPRENQAAILHSIVHDPVPSLRKLRPEAPEELDRIVRRALAKEPEKRYQRLEEMSAALLRLPPEYLPAPASQETLTLTTSSEKTRTPRRSRRLPLRRAAILTGALLAFSALAVLVSPWPQRCLIAPDSFAACRLPEMKHIGILPFEKAGSNESDAVLFEGLEQMIAVKLAQLGKRGNSLCVHRIRTKAQSSGLNLLISGRMVRESENYRLIAVLSSPETSLRLRQLEQRSEAGLMSFQDELLDQLPNIVQVSLPSDLKSGATAIPRAFEFYLRGLGYLDRGDLGYAIESFTQALKEGSEYPAALAGRAEARRQEYIRQEYMMNKKDSLLLSQALDDCTLALKLDSQRAAAYVTLGLIHLQMGQRDQGVNALQRSLELDPLNEDARYQLATVFEEQRGPEAAEKTWREYVNLRPDCWFAYSELGAFLFTHGRNDEAMREYRTALKLAPRNASVFNRLGAFYERTGKLKEAEKSFEECVAIEPNALCSGNLGALYFFWCRYPDSVRAYQRATELAKEDSRLWGSYGEALLKVPEYKQRARGAFKKAIDLAEKRLAKSPRDGEVLRMVANDYAQIGQFDKAEEKIRSALKWFPKDAAVHHRAALVFDLAGKRKPALDELKAALAAGLAVDKICADPDLEKLRSDPQFKQVASGGCPAPASPACPPAAPAPRK